MWICLKCERIFQKANQPHSCHKVSLEDHFNNRGLAKELFDILVKEIIEKIGKCKIISIPCCVHLYGNYDFLAALPKKEKLEIRFVLGRILSSPRLNQNVPVSKRYYKNCINLKNKEEINTELLGWIKEAYHLKD